MLTLAQSIDSVGVSSLILPILVSAVVVFVASAVIWMALPHHKKDLRFLPNESEFDAAIGPLNIEPGFYMFPNCEHARDMKSEAFQTRWKSGPWGTITVMGSAPNFAINLAKSFVSYLLVGLFVAYLTGLALGPGAAYMEVFRVSGAAAVLGYCMGSLANDAFLGKPNRFILTCFIDGVVFALLTAGVFAAMWPSASAPAL